MSELTLVEGLSLPRSAARSACIMSSTLIEHPSQPKHRSPSRSRTRVPCGTPYVVLSRIFEIGVQDTLHERGLPFALLVCQVCQHWRNVVMHSPVVWSSIPVHPLRNGLTQHFLSRAGLGTSLSLFFHITSEWNLDKTLDLLLVHARRVRELSVHVYRSTSVSVFIWRLGRTINLPKLVHLELNWSQDAEGHYLGNLPPIMNTNCPASLTSVVLRGAVFSFKSLALFNLKSLTLAAPSQLVVPLSYVGFRDLLSACPAIEHLKLDGLFPVLTHGVEYPKIHIPTLSHLEIVMEHDNTPDITLKNDKSYISDFLLILFVPAVQKLTFQTDWDVAWHSLRSSVWSLAKTFPNLQHLCLLLGPHDISMHHELFVAFPELHQLTLATHSYQKTLPLLHIWASLIEHSENGRNAWPKFQLLTIHAQSQTRVEEEQLDEVLEQLASRRNCLGYVFDVWKSRCPISTGRTKPRKLKAHYINICKGDQYHGD